MNFSVKLFCSAVILNMAVPYTCIANHDFDTEALKTKRFPLSKMPSSHPCNKILKTKYGLQSITRKNLGAPSNLPSAWSMRSRKLCGAIDDQKNLNSCSANTIAKAMEIDVLRTTKKKLDLSRLFIYYNTRALEGNANQDSGISYMRNGLLAIKQYGSPVESFWPYSNLQDRFKVKPSAKAYELAKQFCFLDNNIRALQQDPIVFKTLLSNDLPIVYGMLLYDSFMSRTTAQTGIVPMPDTSRESIVGGHAVILVGYNDATQMFLGMNSWGPKWGDNGFFHIPYQYILDPSLCWDFYSIKSIGAISTQKKKSNAKNKKAIRVSAKSMKKAAEYFSYIRTRGGGLIKVNAVKS